MLTSDETLALIERVYEGQKELRDLLLVHSRKVAELAIHMVDNHPEIPLDRELVWTGAMLHDIGITGTDAPGIFCHGDRPYICHGIIGAEILRHEGRKQGREEEFEPLARIAERHTGTGLTVQSIESQNLPLPHRDFSPETLEEKVVCFADKFFSKTHPDRQQPAEIVRQKLARFPDANLERFDEWMRLFG